MRRRGWAGSPPKNDQEARNRIVEAAARCVDRLGPSGFSLSEVANELGVSRPTVYRYFPSTDELFSSVGQFVMQEFSDQMEAHLRDDHRPGRVDRRGNRDSHRVAALPAPPHPFACRRAL